MPAKQRLGHILGHIGPAAVDEEQEQRALEMNHTMMGGAGGGAGGGGAGGGDAGGGDAGGRPVEASVASAASADADDDAAVRSASTSCVVSSAQGGAFAQAVADSPIGDVKAAMAGITLPPTAWPSWARDVSEAELLDRLRTNAK